MGIGTTSEPSKQKAQQLELEHLKFAPSHVPPHSHACLLCRFQPVNCIFWPIETLIWLFFLNILAIKII